MVPALALSLLLSWVQVSSETYIVKSSAGEDRAKRVLKELEGFHQLVGALVFRTTELPELPIEVLLVGDDQTLKELAPEYNGRKIDFSGFYQRGQDRDFIVLSGRVYPRELTSVVYHELTHYFLSRALASRPTWLNEGLAEYFATAEVRDDQVSLGALSPQRMQLLKSTSMLPLTELFAVDSSSPYYNESLKASVFYAESWALVYFLTHGEYASRFKQYLDALTKGEANLTDYLGVSERELEAKFKTYLKVIIQFSGRSRTKVSGEPWTMSVETIPDAEAEMSIAEIFLASGNLDDARRHLEVLATLEPGYPRASYYRGVLARITGDSEARDMFVDALLDPQLGPRAAVQLVQMGELHIPAVRTLLQKAAESGTRTSDVYWALSEIYLDDLHRIEEAIRLARKVPEVASTPQISVLQPGSSDTPEPAWQRYAEGKSENLKYELLSLMPDGPHVQTLVPPYYPPELLEQKLSGEVVVDVQVTEGGEVAGLWLVSAMPDIFNSLATSAVREWRFEPVAAKIRVVLDFTP